MFTPLNIKKLTNISIVTLKKFGKRYELAIYPNKLYEYQKKITTNLEEIVYHQTIFKNVSKGEVCSNEDLKLFGKSKDEIIKEILEKGHEQKNEITREREMSMTEKEILDLVRWKVMKNGKFLNLEKIKEVIHKVHNIQPGQPKKQSQEIIFKLEKIGFERINYKIKVNENEVKDYKGIEWRGGYGYVNSLEFPKFRKYCKEKNISYVVTKTEEESEEEIE